MKKKSLYKDISREIWNSKGRFFSILILTMLGVAFFVGLKAVGPDMLHTADQYYKKYHLADVEVLSTYGLDESDEKLLKKVSGVQTIEFGYSADVSLNDSNLVGKVYSTSKKQKINTYQINKGRLPSVSGEIAIDNKLSNQFKIGDTITFSENKDQSLSDTFHKSTYKVVGFVTSSKYIEKSERGVSTIGKGKTDAFLIIPEQDFKMNVYTVASIVFDNTSNDAAYSAQYEKQIDKNIKAIEKALKNQPQEKLATMKQKALIKINESETKLNKSKQELANNEQQLANAKSKIYKAREEYRSGETELYNQLQVAESKLNQSEAQLNASKKELDEAPSRIANGKKAIAEGQAKIKEAEQVLDTKQKQLDAQRQQLEQLGLLHGDNLAKIKAAQAQLTLERNKLLGAKQQLANQEVEIRQAENALKIGTEKYKEGKAQLAAGREQYETEKEKGMQELANVKAKIDASEQEYEKSLALFQKEKPKAERRIADAEEKIVQAKADVAKLELPKYYVNDRSNNPRYTDFKDNANRITSLASIFPVLFFLIAALVCLTTMTRMVDEQRTQIGLLKGLGYHNKDIISKYFIYGSLASVIGSIFGLLIGLQLFTRIIYNAYLTMFDMPKLTILFDFKTILLAVIVALLCTSVTAYVATKSILRSNAATLMRPKAPKNGQRILLEKVGFIWKRLNFTSKVTARNLFRYKKRMFMTIIGVAGCTALMFTGYGLRDTIQDLVPLQYNEIMKYDAAVLLSNDIDTPHKKSYDQLIESNKNVSSKTSVFQANMTAVKKGVNNQEVTIMVPEKKEELNTFITLRHMDNKKSVHVPNEGAVLSKKLASLYGVNPGDTLIVKNSDDEQIKVKVKDIVEMYAGHFIFVSPTYYQSIFGDKPIYNVELLKLKNTKADWQDNFAEQLMNNSGILAVSYTNTFSNLLQDTMDSLNVVVIVLIVCAALLAFVVLYNLSNINVSERIRELSTIKVLGFYPKEVTMYVYRENIILTILGIGLGFVLGNALLQIVITTVEVDEVMFSHVVHWTSYVYSAILTIIFSLLVMLVMHIKLKRVDMIEALKSVE
ncbi:FtsX-like permease family protein [Bacillus massiliigorillae]|uniref:FtsX-like permease family protein n=1 Tax=Bacillus massiliigorillae TaxID=1243664 RepID=UPI0003A2C521|nr:FtsX-like permease family protein [Bacillus massiliigorillae]